MNRTERRASEARQRRARRSGRFVSPESLPQLAEFLTGFTPEGQAVCRSCRGVMLDVGALDFFTRYVAKTGRQDLPPWIERVGAYFWCDACDLGRALVEGPEGTPLRVNIGGGCSCEDCG